MALDPPADSGTDTGARRVYTHLADITRLLDAPKGETRQLEQLEGTPEHLEEMRAYIESRGFVWVDRERCIYRRP